MPDSASGEQRGEEQRQPEGFRRLNWGCGTDPTPGWLNADVGEGHLVEISCDIREGLPLEDASIDYVVSIHALSELPYKDLETALAELKRLLLPGGVLRLALPDLERAMHAYLDGNVGYFPVPDDDARSLGGKMILYLTRYGYSRSLYTFDSIEELLLRAGFRRVVRCGLGESTSEYTGITELDHREIESLFVEAVK